MILYILSDSSCLRADRSRGRKTRGVNKFPYSVHPTTAAPTVKNKPRDTKHQKDFTFDCM